MFVTLNIASVSDSHHSSIGFLALSFTMPRPMANTMLKTTICSTSPVAIASMIEVGTMCSRIWSQVCAWALTGGAPVAAGNTSPTPGFITLTVKSPMSSASVVTISK